MCIVPHRDYDNTQDDTGLSQHLGIMVTHTPEWPGTSGKPALLKSQEKKHITVQALSRPYPLQAVSDARMLVIAMLLIASSTSSNKGLYDLPTPLCQCNCAPHLHATAAAAHQNKGQLASAALHKGMIQ